MFKSKFSSLAVAAALAMGVATGASALTLTSGNYKISFDNYDSGTTGYGDTSGVKCLTVATCDGAAASTAPGSVGSVNTSADTMGIMSVSGILNTSTGITEYTRGTAGTIGGVAVGPFLTGVFGDLADRAVEVTCGIAGCTTTALSTGGSFRLWSNTSDWDPTTGPGTGGGNDLNAGIYLPSISGGTLFLEGVFAAGAALFGDATTTYVTTFNNGTLFGGGGGMLDFTGGAALAFFDTNARLNVNGGLNDAILSTTFFPTAESTALGWTVVSSGQAEGELQVVPEPGSIALIAAALLAAAGVSRRRKA